MNDAAETEARYSAGWWESRTVEELQELARTGLASGEAGSGALRELERRAHQREVADRQQTELRGAQKEAMRIRLLVIVFVTLLIAVIAIELLR